MRVFRCGWGISSSTHMEAAFDLQGLKGLNTHLIELKPVSQTQTGLDNGFVFCDFSVFSVSAR